MRAFSAASFAVAAALVPQALAGVFLTSPVGTTSCKAGVNCPITWNDDGKPPLLKDLGSCSIALYTGNAQQQTLLQSISASYNMAQFGSIDWLPDASVGPNSNLYFIRIEALNFKSLDNPAVPYQSFSAKFSLTGMTGQWTPEISSQLQGLTSPGGMPPTTTPVAISTTPPAVSTTPPAASGASSNSTKPTNASPSKASASASGSAKPNSAVKLGSVGAAGALGSILALVLGSAI
jgi:hypothetical protein